MWTRAKAYQDYCLPPDTGEDKTVASLRLRKERGHHHLTAVRKNKICPQHFMTAAWETTKEGKGTLLGALLHLGTVHKMDVFVSDVYVP